MATKTLTINEVSGYRVIPKFNEAYKLDVASTVGKGEDNACDFIMNDKGWKYGVVFTIELASGTTSADIVFKCLNDFGYGDIKSTVTASGTYCIAIEDMKVKGMNQTNKDKIQFYFTEAVTNVMVVRLP